CLVRLQVQQLDGLQAGIDRLDERCLLVRHVLRDFHQALGHDPIHHADVLGKTSAAGLKAGGHSDLLVHRALCERLVAAVVAFSAWDMVKDHHPVADLEVFDALAHGSNPASGLMTENSRRRVRAGGYLLEVGAADPASVYPYEHFSRAYLRDRYH